MINLNFFDKEPTSDLLKPTPKNIVWTKKEVETILDSWEDHSVKEIAGAIGRSGASIQYIVGKLRKVGFKLKSKYSRVTNSSIIREALEELPKSNIIN